MRLHLVAAAAFLLAAAATPSVAQNIVIHAGRLIDGVDGKVHPRMTIVVRDDRIVAVEQGFTTREGATIINLEQDTVLPGLIDLHTHLTMSQNAENPIAARFSRSDLDRALFAVKPAVATLEAGFTSVRDVGGLHYIDIALKRAIDAGTIAGPRMWVAGPVLSPTGGHSDEANGIDPAVEDGAWTLSVADGADGFAAAVRRNRRAGTDLIKIADSGGTGSIGDDPRHKTMTDAEIRATVETAHALGMKVAVHAQNKAAVDAAVIAGVDSIEHGAGADAGSYRLMKEHGTYLVPTMLIAEKLRETIAEHPQALNKGTAEKVLGLIANKRERTCAAYRAGVKIGFGTDVRVEYGANALRSSPAGKNINAQEFKLLVDACLPPMEAIFTATRNAADLIGASDRIGSIQPERYADIIAVKGNPIEDITELERVRFVMKGGAVVRNDEVAARP